METGEKNDLENGLKRRRVASIWDGRERERERKRMDEWRFLLCTNQSTSWPIIDERGAQRHTPQLNMVRRKETRMQRVLGCRCTQSTHDRKSEAAALFSFPSTLGFVSKILPVFLAMYQTRESFEKLESVLDPEREREREREMKMKRNGEEEFRFTRGWRGEKIWLDVTSSWDLIQLPLSLSLPSPYFSVLSLICEGYQEVRGEGGRESKDWIVSNPILNRNQLILNFILSSPSSSLYFLYIHPSNNISLCLFRSRPHHGSRVGGQMEWTTRERFNNANRVKQTTEGEREGREEMFELWWSLSWCTVIEVSAARKKMMKRTDGWIDEWRAKSGKERMVSLEEKNDDEPPDENTSRLSLSLSLLGPFCTDFLLIFLRVPTVIPALQNPELKFKNTQIILRGKKIEIRSNFTPWI